MNVGIVTYHRASNYGAVFQSYALTKYINEIGHNCETIDYRSKYLEKIYGACPTVRGVSIKEAISQIINTPIRIARKKQYSSFRNQYVPLSKVYDENNIKETNNKYDCFVFGSDQIWNSKLNGGDLNYFGEFVENESKMNSYAASFGDYLTSLSNKERIISLLSRFNRVGIREHQGVQVFEELTYHEACEVLDPVFLLTKKQWESLLDKTTNKTNSGFIFIYHLKGKTTCVEKCALEISKKTGLKVINGQALIRNNPKGIILKYSLSPLAFLSYIRDADYIVTDSFHCTAFSIIFNKKFWALKEKGITDKESRIGNLLLKLGLSKRLLSEIPIEFKFDIPIDYTDSCQKLEALIQSSRDFIYTILR